MEILKKIGYFLFTLGGILLIGVAGFQAIVIYKSYRLKKEKMEFEYGAEKDRKAELEHERGRQEQEDRIRDLTEAELKGFNPKGKGKVLDPRNIEHNGIINSPAGITCNVPAPTLIYDDKINFFLAKILNDIIKVKNSDNLNEDGSQLEPDKENDSYSKYLRRDNALLFGTPGTGKTVFVNELAHHLYIEYYEKNKIRFEANEETVKRFEEAIEDLKADTTRTEQEKLHPLSQLEEELELAKQDRDEFFKKNRVPMILTINGKKMTVASGIEKNSMTVDDKIVEVIKYHKKLYYGDEFSNEPYIVFFEECDQMGDVMTRSKGAYLEELKNWLDNSENLGGIELGSQDPNSIILATTNNFEDIDPGIYRRGRLGEKLDFNWTPDVLKRYGEAGNNGKWPKINWPNEPGWSFENNVNFAELSKLCGRLAYSSFKDKFANKANQIINSYHALSADKKKHLEEKVLGQHVGENDSKICNWLLHFMWSYWQKESNLTAFTDISQLTRYDFGNAFFMREEIQNVYKQIGVEIDAIKDSSKFLRELVIAVDKIGQFLASMESLRQEVNNLKASLNDVDRKVDNYKSQLLDNIRTLQDNISRVNGRVDSIQSQISGLQSSLSSARSEINSARSEAISARSEASSLSSSYSENSSKISRAISKLNSALFLGIEGAGLARVEEAVEILE